MLNPSKRLFRVGSYRLDLDRFTAPKLSDQHGKDAAGEEAFVTFN
ncbi:MAG TPA: hypothetical protein VF614_08955 [Chthoniobacteraceae bacterium]